MPVISFGEQPNQIWGGAGWAFRQAVKDLSRYARGNKPFLAALEEAEHIGHLGVEGLEPALRDSVITAIKEMCIGIISGAHPSTINESFPGDRTAQDGYHEAIKGLLLMAEAAQRGTTPSS
jgi:hypothetical protein